MAEVSLFVEHAIVYGNKQPLPVQDVVDSLLAMRRLSRSLLPRALSLLTDSKVLSVDVLVDGFEQGSFKESFWLQVVFSSERSMKRFQKALRTGDLAGMYKELPLGNKPVIKIAVVSAVVAALVAYGVLTYVGDSQGSDQQALIQANNNTIIAIGAEAYQIDPAAFAKVIEATAEGKRKQLVSDAAKILAPAHHDSGASVSFGKGGVINSSTVAAMPTDLDFDEQESEQPLSNVVVDIRSTNRDSVASGWHAHIVGLFDERVKLTLGEKVAIDDLAGKLQVRADVDVRYRMNPAKKKMVPVEITIIAVRHEAERKAPSR